jgi:hypothetical protein
MMKTDHIDRWQKYLAATLQEQYGVGRQQADQSVTNWLAEAIPEAVSRRERRSVARGRLTGDRQQAAAHG